MKGNDAHLNPKKDSTPKTQKSQEIVINIGMINCGKGNQSTLITSVLKEYDDDEIIRYLATYENK